MKQFGSTMQFCVQKLHSELQTEHTLTRLCTVIIIIVIILCILFFIYFLSLFYLLLLFKFCFSGPSRSKHR